MSNVIEWLRTLLTYLANSIGSILVHLRRSRNEKGEHDPVTEDEFVLRRIHKNNYKPQQNPPVLRVAFEPKDEDHDGLSFHRRLFVSAEDLGFSGRKPGEYYVASFSVAILRGPDYQLTINPAPHPDPTEPRGHCVIPQLSIDHLEADAEKSKSIQRKLAKLASANIVYVPADCIVAP